MRTDGTNDKGFVEGGFDTDGLGIRLGPPSWGAKP
jgi:hypothetical protein